LIVTAESGFILVAGCAHPGICDMLSCSIGIAESKPLLVLGGFHLKSTPEAEVEQIAAKLKTLGADRIAPCHCTGDRSIAVFERVLGADYAKCSVGAVFEF